MNGHFHLTGNRLADLTTIADQHGQRHPVKLYQRCQRINGHTNCCVLHNDGRAFSAHMRACTQPHAFIFTIRRNMVNILCLIDFFDHTGKLLAGHSGDKINTIFCQRIHYDVIYRHLLSPFYPLCLSLILQGREKPHRRHHTD